MSIHTINMLPELYKLIFQNLDDSDIKTMRTICKQFSVICMDHEFELLFYDSVYDETFYPQESSFVFKRCKEFILKYTFDLPRSLKYINSLVIENSFPNQKFISNQVYTNVKKLHVKYPNIDINEMLPILSNLESLRIDNLTTTITFLPKTIQYLQLPYSYHNLCELPDGLTSLKFGNDKFSEFNQLNWSHGRGVLPQLHSCLRKLYIGGEYTGINLSLLPDSLRKLRLCPGFSGTLESLDMLCNLERLEITSPINKIMRLPHKLKSLCIRNYKHNFPNLPESLEHLIVNYADNFDYQLIPQNLLSLKIKMVTPIKLPIIPPNLHTLIILAKLMDPLPVLPQTLRILKLHTELDGPLSELPESLKILFLDYRCNKLLPEYPPRELEELWITHMYTHNHIIPYSYKNVKRIYTNNCAYCHKIHPHILEKIVFIEGGFGSEIHAYSEAVSEQL